MSRLFTADFDVRRRVHCDHPVSFNDLEKVLESISKHLRGTQVRELFQDIDGHRLWYFGIHSYDPSADMIIGVGPRYATIELGERGSYDLVGLRSCVWAGGSREKAKVTYKSMVTHIEYAAALMSNHLKC
ncbi:MAG: hypothetical protein Q7R56_02260 [Nanoarchaeota archaeon]|nr:hypothetical protein [Nanoarchaeota archaeon]